MLCMCTCCTRGPNLLNNNIVSNYHWCKGVSTSSVFDALRETFV